MIENNSYLENAEKGHVVPKENIHTPERPVHQQDIPTETDIPTAAFEKSGLRLITDLQHRLKAQQSKAYAAKAKLTNLQTMTKTLSYTQEHK